MYFWSWSPSVNVLLYYTAKFIIIMASYVIIIAAA